MEWLVLMVAGGGVVFGARRLLGRRTRQNDEMAELEGVRRLADEDVTLLGEELQRTRHPGFGAPARRGRPSRLPACARRLRVSAADRATHSER